MKRHSVVIGAILVLAALAVPARAGFEATHRFSSDELVVRNLIGEVRVQGHGGSAFEVVVKVQGRDATPERVRIEETERGLNVVFPLDEDKHYVYPRLSPNSTTTFTLSESESGWLSSVLRGLLGGGRVTVTGKGRGLEVWADVEVRVPRGGELTVKHGVGEIHAEEIDGDLVLDNSSGAVRVAGVNGRVNVDTGSGGVTVSDVAGELLIDTGSGGVVLDRISGGRLSVDTGSGSVEASAISADSAAIDTGSGSVTLQLDRMGDGEFEIDTGSGRITLSVPRDASADVHASTGSGGIDLDLEGVELKRKERDEVSFSMGGGAARVTLDTGSGGIRITGSN